VRSRPPQRTDVAGLAKTWLREGTGAIVAIRTIDVLTVVDGRIAAVCVLGDELGTLVGLGAVALRERMDRGAGP